MHFCISWDVSEIKLVVWGICGRLEAYIGYKGDIKSKVEQLELFRRNLGRRHIMELEENEKAGIECRNRSNINFSSQTFPGLNLSADYNLTQGGMEGYFIERKCLFP